MKQYQIETVVDAHGADRWMGTAVAKSPMDVTTPKTRFIVILEQTAPGLFTASLWERGNWSTHHLYRAVGNMGYGAVMTRVKIRRPEQYADEVAGIVKAVVGWVSDAKPETTDAWGRKTEQPSWGVVAFRGTAPTQVIEVPDND